MATLVLTTVGGAIGGPVGAALGGLVGQRVDRTLLFPPPSRQGPRLTELAVQTSTYGAPIPKVFGRARIAGIVIWATDLIETRATSRAGKGQPGTTTYSYAASFAVALSARAIRDVGRVWADGKLLRGAAGDWKAAATFRLHRGGEAQAPDPLIASAVDAAPAHRGVAYAMFEQLQLADFGNRIPSLTFEVIADEAPMRVGDIARELSGGAITGAGPDDAVQGFAASGDSAAGAISVLATIAGGWFAPADGGVVLANCAPGTPPVAIDDAAVARMRRPIETVPARLRVQHYDPARDYQIGVQQARRGGGGWRDEAVELPAVLDAAAAKAIAAQALAARERGRETIELSCDAGALAVRPGDVVTTPALPGAWRVARASVERMAVTLSLAALPGAATPMAADAGQMVSAPDEAAGDTLLHVFELPPLDATLPVAPLLAVSAAGSAPGWRRAALMTSRDGGTWEAAGGTAAPATSGVLAAPLPRAPSTLVDRRHVIELVFPHDMMTLASASARAIDAGGNLALIGDELVQFRHAEQVAPARWRLRTLLRGRRGTGSVAHAAGTRFVLIERDTLAWLPAGVAAPGEMLRVAASGIGDTEAPATATAVASGVSVAPPAPVRLRASRQPDGTLAIAWHRRSRGGWAWRDGADVPLVEEQERYRVRVTGDGDEQSAVVDLPRWRSPVIATGPITVGVCQIGTLATSPETCLTIA